jgi:hypothetical protein
MFKQVEMNLKISLKNEINECIINDDDNNKINHFKNIFIFSILSSSSRSSIRKFNHVFAISYIWKYKFVKIFILVTAIATPISSTS